MEKEKTFTLGEAQLYFAKTLNGEVWQLLEKPERTGEEDGRMVFAAYASAYHWLNAGTEVNQQRGEWLIARVWSVLGEAESALRHAGRCLALTNEYADQMKDFDLAFAHEGMARALALAGRRDEAKQYLLMAEESGKAIQDEEDKKIFMGDFNGGDWHGIK